MIDLGRAAFILALVFALAGVVFLALGVRWERRDLVRNGYFAVYAFFLGTAAASAVLLAAFLKKDFSFAYVAENSDASLSVFYRISGFWAGQSGSFLLWLFLLAIATLVVTLRDRDHLERLTGGAVMVLCAVSAVFAALMIFDEGSNPFLAAAPGTTPFGLNPLLLHPGMVLHPPALFIGYVGLTVPFAFAIGALLVGRADRLWVKLSQKWAMFGWLFLSLGIGLGAWWAYVVLSFGGFWAWDPVENTSLVPWLTATALLHAMTLYRTRGMFKRWALAAAALTFFFVILATWTTRTGLISSVHAFERNDVLIAHPVDAARRQRLLSAGLLGLALAALRQRHRDRVGDVAGVHLPPHGPASRALRQRDRLLDGGGAAAVRPDRRPRDVRHVRAAARRRLPRARLDLSAARVAQDRRRPASPGPASCRWRPRCLSVPALAAAGLPVERVGPHRSRRVRLRLRRRAAVRRQRGAAGGRPGQRLDGRSAPRPLRQPHAQRRRTSPTSAWSSSSPACWARASTSCESTALVSTKDDGDSSLLTDDGKYLLEFTGTRSESGSQQSQRTYADFDVFTDGGSTSIGTVDPHTDIYPVSGAAVARGHPRSPVRGRLRGHRRAVRRAVGDDRPAGRRLPAHPLAVDRLDPALRRRRRVAVAADAALRRRSPTTRPSRAAARARPRPEAAPVDASGRDLSAGAAAAPLEIEVDGLRKTFGRREVLRGLSFALERGGFLAMFGPNGAGKTTTLRVLATLLTPSQGSVRVAGHDVREDPMPVRQAVGLISHARCSTST